MIFSDLPESSPPTVNTGYFDEILACSIFVCWSNISMMNHWRCPPSNPGNEKRYKVAAGKNEMMELKLENRSLGFKIFLSLILWVNAIVWMMDLTSPWFQRKRSQVQHMFAKNGVFSVVELYSQSTKVNTKAGVWWNDSIFDRRKSRTKVKQSFHSNLYFGKSSRRNFSHFANV